MRRELGMKGEQLAAQFLKQEGYRILERNYRTRYGEIDIICSKKGVLAFVEVKSRRSYRYGSAEEAITPAKIKHIQQVALSYLSRAHEHFDEIRFDVIAVDFSQNPPDINHLLAAF